MLCKKCKSSVTVLLVLSLCCGVWAAGTVYVDANATGSCSGADWTNAYTQVQSAFPGTSGDTIKIAKGTYQVSTSDPTAVLSISSSVTVEGGYVYDAALGVEFRDPKAFESIITADVNGDDAPIADLFEDPLALENACLTGSHIDNGKYIFSLSSVSGITIDGLVLKGVYSQAGAFGSALDIVYCSNITVKNCRFVENYGGNNLRGNALFIHNNSTGIVVQDCVFTANTATAWEGAVRVEDTPAATGTDATFRNCLFTGNSNHRVVPDDWGGGATALCIGDPGWVTLKVYDCVMVRNSNGTALVHGGYDYATVEHPNRLEVYNTVITGNENPTGTHPTSPGSAAGVKLHGSGSSDPAIMTSLHQNCLIAENGVTHGGGAGLFIWRNTVSTIVNCTIANNQGPSAIGEGVFARMQNLGSAGPIVTQKNCIIWGNSGCDNHLEVPLMVPVATVTYSCIDDSDGDPNNYTGDGTCTTSDPQFVDSDCHLASTSPCIDTGDDTDSVGSEPKCNGGRINMGAYGGTVNATPTSEGAGTKAGDINCDGEQNLADFQILAGQWLE